MCSGIEAATAAWHPLGWEPAFFSEIEAFPSAVLKYHYPDVPLHGDFTTIGQHQYGRIDLLVGGTPCQSFSVAGLRGGLDDDRGNLALEFCRLAQREQPRWIVWENVPGVLSSGGGRDFGSILGALEDLGYGLAYRVLDAQFFGVPQRRRRVFVVGYLGDWRPAAAVLFERHGLSGHPAPRREAREDTTHGAAPCFTSSGRGVERTGDTRGQDPVVAVGRERSAVGVEIGPSGASFSEVNPTLDTRAKDGPIRNQLAGAVLQCAPTLRAGGQMSEPMVDINLSQTLQAKNPQAVAYAIQERAVSLNLEAGPQGSGFRDDNTAYTLEARNKVQAVVFDTTQITSPQNYSNPQPGDPCHPLAAGAHPPAIAFAQNTRDEVRLYGGDGQIVGALAAQPGMKQTCYVAQPVPIQNATRGKDQNGLGIGGEVMYTLDKTSQHGVAYGFQPRIARNGRGDMGDVVSALSAQSGETGKGDAAPCVAVAFDWKMGAKARSIGLSQEQTPTLSTGADRYAVMTQNWAVRRLTPVECERLQGFPDGFTDIPWRKKPAGECPDGPRYKALGNSMAVPVMHWIGKRIQLVDDLLSLL